MKPIGFILALTLVGCASEPKPPIVRTTQHENSIPIPAKCQAVVTRPDIPDATEVLKSATDDRFVQLLGAGRLARDPYISQLEAGFTGCGGRIE